MFFFFFLGKQYFFKIQIPVYVVSRTGSNIMYLYICFPLFFIKALYTCNDKQISK